MIWADYHEATKHTVERLRASRHFLDWATMPDPWRHYEGAPVVDLPADPVATQVAVSDVLCGSGGEMRFDNGADFLSTLFYHAAAVSASKVVPSTGYRYALRVNPSSGNLHPTEFHFAARGVEGWEDGVYHYRPSQHTAEQRGRGSFDSGFGEPLVILLTSIAWREAWKYQSRAYRYCLHDAGHAWECVAQAARAMGCRVEAMGEFDDGALTRGWRLADDEWPMMILRVSGAALPVAANFDSPLVWTPGEANKLSESEVDYPWIERVQAACAQLAGGLDGEGLAGEVGKVALPTAARAERAWGETVRRRRSALDFVGGEKGMSAGELAALLEAVGREMAGDFCERRRVRLYLYVHRVAGWEPGVYLWRPNRQGLERVLQGDQRVTAAGLSLGQALAGNACVAFSMVADLDGATARYGDRGYRYAHFEAGAVGQRLYVMAEGLGLRATGIGAFYDDRVQEYLGLERGDGQVIYHFAIGHAVVDPRLDAIG